MAEEIEFNQTELLIIQQSLDSMCEQLTGMSVEPHRLSSHAMQLVSLAEARRKVIELRNQNRGR